MNKLQLYPKKKYFKLPEEHSERRYNERANFPISGKGNCSYIIPDEVIEDFMDSEEMETGMNIDEFIRIRYGNGNMRLACEEMHRLSEKELGISTERDYDSTIFTGKGGVREFQSFNSTLDRDKNSGLII
ncbi:hypothetical protein GF336_00325 [Candidatus Woesearchaeota archaeon]|nr:hypothetical protein [Candidatus Woesearchaeota archaeon]